MISAQTLSKPYASLLEGLCPTNAFSFSFFDDAAEEEFGMW
jgi:hypothetical protein